MNCPKCNSDNVSYSMKKDSEGFMHAYVQCSSCGYKWEREMITQSRYEYATDKEKIQREGESSENNKCNATKPKSHKKKNIKLVTWILLSAIILIVIAILIATNPLAALVLVAICAIGFFINYIYGVIKKIYGDIKNSASYKRYIFRKNYSQNTISQDRVSDSQDRVSDDDGRFYSTRYEENDTRYTNSMNGIDYEKYVAQRLKNEGYAGVTVTQASGDHGADIIAISPEGKRVAIQCKKYSKSVGQRSVQEAVSAKVYYNCDLAMVITNSYFTPAAKDFAEHTGVILRENYK